MSISNLLVVPDPVNSPFYFSGGALVLVFTITRSELVVWDMASGTKGQVQSILATTSLHYPLLKNDIKNVMQTLLLTSLRSSQRDIFPVPCPCMLPKQKCRLYFLYCHLPIHLMWVIPSVHNGMDKGRRFISLYPKHGASPMIHQQAVIKGTKSYSEKIDNTLPSVGQHK